MTLRNLTIRILTQEPDSSTSPIPTVLIRLTELTFTKPSTEAPPLYEDSSDVVNLIADKTLSVGVLSVHLMADYFLDPHEYSTDETASALD